MSSIGYYPQKEFEQNEWNCFTICTIGVPLRSTQYSYTTSWHLVSLHRDGCMGTSTWNLMVLRVYLSTRNLDENFTFLNGFKAELTHHIEMICPRLKHRSLGDHQFSHHLVLVSYYSIFKMEGFLKFDYSVSQRTIVIYAGWFDYVRGLIVLIEIHCVHCSRPELNIFNGNVFFMLCFLIVHCDCSLSIRIHCVCGSSPQWRTVNWETNSCPVNMCFLFQ